MAVIASPTGAQVAEVMASPVLALRTAVVDAAGNMVDRVFDGSYMAMITIAPGTLADGTAYMALFNSSLTKNVYITDIDLSQGFSGTAAASRSAYRFTRFAGNAPTGVAPVTPVPLSTAMPASVVQQFGLDSGITVAGLETRPFHSIQLANQLSAAIVQDLDFEEAPLVLGPSQGIVISALGAIVAGSFLAGMVTWREGA